MNYSNELEMLDAILFATQNNRLVWRQVSPGRYHGTGAIEIFIQEVSPLIAGDTETAGVQAFQIELNRLDLTFWSGTAGCNKILEILSAGVSEFSEHDTVVVAKVNEVIKLFGRSGMGPKTPSNP